MEKQGPMSIFGKNYDRQTIDQHFEHDPHVQEDHELADEEEDFDRDIFFDKNHKAYKHVSELSFGIDRIPEKLLNRALKVFSKHSSQDVREWSSQLIKSY